MCDDLRVMDDFLSVSVASNIVEIVREMTDEDSK